MLQRTGSRRNGVSSLWCGCRRGGELLGIAASGGVVASRGRCRQPAGEAAGTSERIARHDACWWW